MASKLFTLLFILPTIYARINVDITASDNEGKRAVVLYGSNIAVISDLERHTFGLSDRNLKDAVTKYFGKRPSDVYVKSPTPWGDLYSTYNWAQVTRILTPQKAKILGVRAQPMIIQTQEFSNNSTKTASFSVKIQQQVENRVLSSWEQNHDLTARASIEYGISIEALSGKSSFSYSSNWGEGVSKSEIVTVGSSSGVLIFLEPNQHVSAELYANKGHMDIEVEYETSLSGTVAVNYDDMFKGHHFWALDVNAVMAARGLDRTKQSKEVIRLMYYTDSQVVIKDMRNDNVMYTIPLKMY